MDPLRATLLRGAKDLEEKAKALRAAADALGVGTVSRAAARPRRRATTEIRRKGHTIRECQYRNCKRRFRGHVDQLFCTNQHGNLERHAKRKEAKA